MQHGGREVSGSRSETLAVELRARVADSFVQNRRRIAVLSATGIGCMTAIALYQIGAVRQVPDLPFPKMNSERIIGSAAAYAHLDVGDGCLGVLSYSTTLLLAGAGGRGRSHDRPWLPIALAVKTAVDALVALKLTFDELTKYRVFCTPCVVAASAAIAALPLAIPEAKAACMRRTR